MSERPDKNISMISPMPQEMLEPKPSEAKKRSQPKIVDNEDMTQWPTLQDWQVAQVVRVFAKIRSWIIAYSWQSTKPPHPFLPFPL